MSEARRNPTAGCRSAPACKLRDLMAELLIRGAWAAYVVTLFPDTFPGILGLSPTGRALAEGAVEPGARPTDLRVLASVAPQ